MSELVNAPLETKTSNEGNVIMVAYGDLKSGLRSTVTTRDMSERQLGSCSCASKVAGVLSAAGGRREARGGDVSAADGAGAGGTRGPLQPRPPPALSAPRPPRPRRLRPQHAGPPRRLPRLSRVHRRTAASRRHRRHAKHTGGR